MRTYELEAHTGSRLTLGEEALFSVTTNIEVPHTVFIEMYLDWKPFFKATSNMTVNKESRLVFDLDRAEFAKFAGRLVSFRPLARIESTGEIVGGPYDENCRGHDFIIEPWSPAKTSDLIKQARGGYR